MARLCGYFLALTWMRFVFSLNDPILSPTLFYPFGEDVGDSIMATNDDGSSGEVPIAVGFPFFATSNNKLFVNTNGAISFGVAVTSYTPAPFPVAFRMIAPYWCDIDTTRNTGRIYYRQSQDEKLLNRATQDVLKSFASRGLYFFKAKWIFIATWHNVTYYGGGPKTPINSFQAVLITDGKHSIALFNYGWISWTTGTSSGGDGNTGLGGTAAQVGFNAGDNVNFFAVPGSRDHSIVEIEESSNTGMKGRWMFRVDSAKIEVSSSCESTGKCEAHQSFNEKTGECEDIAPAFKCPTLEGPEVIKRRWVEFYCAIPTNETKKEANFEVTFLFNAEPDPMIPIFTIRHPERRAILHEKHLTHKNLGKWISCRVVSYWSNSATSAKSGNLISTNSYYAGIEVSSYLLSVHEGDQNPATLTLKSTIPITCRSFEQTLESEDSCDLTFSFRSTTDIVLLQTDTTTCSHTLTEAHWNATEKKAYRTDKGIELYAKIDLIVSGPRYNTLTIDIGSLPTKSTIDGQIYQNMWSKHALPEILVYHYDVPNGVCRAYGDPNLTTLDRFFYSVYASGQFTYIQTTHGPPVEIQVRHKPCGQVVSCVCGVAAREKDIILVAEKCTDPYVHTVTFGEIKDLPKGTGIRQDKSGNSLEIRLPSKIRVVAYVKSWGLNIEIYVTSAEYRRTEGLCGTFDQNKDNDLWIKGQDQSSTNSKLAQVVESWRVPNGFSLFDDYKSKLNQGPAPSVSGSKSYCSCQGVGNGDCGSSNFDNKIFEGGTGLDRFGGNTLKMAGKYLDKKIQNLRRKRAADSNIRMTDDIDWEYDGSAFYRSVPLTQEAPRNVSWPTKSGITEADARQHCQRILWDESPVKTDCEKVVDMSDINGIINKCVSDTKMTGDLSWADDKIPEVQNLCIFETLTINVTETNTTIEDVHDRVLEISALVCVPQDCSKHGTCLNGNCACYKGYVGSDCAHSEDAVPRIVRALGQPSCDVDRFLCEKVEFITEDVASLPTLTCKVDVTKKDNSSESFKTSAFIESLQTSSCKLPTHAYQKGLQLLHEMKYNITTTTSPDSEFDFYSLPDGNPVLYYSISISNNGLVFSNVQRLTAYESKCYSCDGQPCSPKNNTCEIKGYCFQEKERNPFDPECDVCDPSLSSTAWTKLPDPLCNPCSSSPCTRGSTCVSRFKNKYKCIDKFYALEKTTVILIICFAIITVILAVLLVIIFLRYRRRKGYESTSENEQGGQDEDRHTDNMKMKLTGTQH